MDDENMAVDATEQPLEFALLALDLIHDQELHLEESAQGEAAELENGFRLQFDLGNALQLTLDYDQEAAAFVARVGATSLPEPSERWRVALTLNDLMPLERRFVIDAASQQLIIKETWYASHLGLAQFATGLRSLIDVMGRFLNFEVVAKQVEPVPDASYIRV
jgi:hypothetical protein